MQLEQVLSLRGIKLLDANVFHTKGNILERLYICETHEDFPLEDITITSDFVREMSEAFYIKNVFSMQAVACEVEDLLFKLNQQKNFHSSARHRLPHFLENTLEEVEEGTRVLHRHRADNEFIAKRRENLISIDKTAENSNCTGFDYLNVLCKNLTKLIKFIREKDIALTFSEEEKDLYKRFEDYFVGVCEMDSSLKVDFSDKHEILKARKPSNYQTDEKLVSATLTLSLTRIEQPILISSDSDLRRILSFFYSDDRYAQEFNLKKPPYKIAMYSDFGRGFELQPIPGFEYKNS